MANEKSLFTSESVSMGHPDKVSDQVSDAILDAFLAGDPKSRVACETLCNTGLIVVAGEISSKATVQIPEIVRDTVRDIGYTDGSMGLDADSCSVLVALDPQSPDIAMGVDEGADKEQGAGDQGLMFGYACDETPECMPLSIALSHKLVERQAEARKSGELAYLRPDAKSQVTIEYQDGVPARVAAVVLSTQHAEEVSLAQIREDVLDKIIKKVIPANLLDDDTLYHINPTGRFVLGGPHGDCGLTGRKIIVDTYGGHGRHGGGAFSGKDPSKVDRSAAYLGRHIAKSIVHSKLAKKAEVQLSYAIGVAEPTSVRVETFGTGTHSDAELSQLVRDNFQLTPKGLIDSLELLRPIYKETARHGHFGRELPNFTWEKPKQLG